MPDFPPVFVHVPDMEFPSLFTIPVKAKLAVPSLKKKIRFVVLDDIIEPVICWPCAVPPTVLPDCVKVTTSGPCSPAAPFVVRNAFQLPAMFVLGGKLLVVVEIIIAFHVPECPFVLVQVPAMVIPLSLTVPA